MALVVLAAVTAGASQTRALPKIATTRVTVTVSGGNLTAPKVNTLVLSHTRGTQIGELSSCPRVYIYDISSLWDYPVPLAHLQTTPLNDVMGVPCPDGTFRTNQYGLSEILIYRLSTSKRCAPTTDPKQAQLFLVPAFPAAKPMKGWIKACTGDRKKNNPRRYLKHLDASNAHRHFFIAGKGHKNLRLCDWWHKPQGLLQRFMRVSYSMPAHGKWDTLNDSGDVEGGPYGPYDSPEWPLARLRQLMDADSDDVRYPHAYSVPYPSDVHWSPSAGPGPWTLHSRPRKHLVSFLGGRHGAYGLAVREKIIEDCSAVGRPLCDLVVTDPRNSSMIRNPHCQIRAHKENSVFCLEPGGDSPYRKSLADSLLLGCIPVIFSPYLQLVSEWHWGPYRNSSHVYVNQQDYLDGRVDLFAHLQRLVDTGVASAMRKTIADNAHSMQYALEDYPGDAVETLLHGLNSAAMRREARQPALAAGSRGTRVPSSGAPQYQL